MSKNKFNSEFEEIDLITDIDDLESDEIREVIVTKSGKKRLGRKRRWREIDNIHDKLKLKKELEDLEDYKLWYIIY